MALDFIPVTTKKQIGELARLADGIWHEHFVSIISDAQIDYMVERFQSEQAIENQMNAEGYRYFFLVRKDTVIGYTGFREEEGKLFLSKIYIKREYRKKGFAGRAFAFLEGYCQARGLGAIYLTVNRHNLDSVQVYKSLGFKVVREQAKEIGNGFVMDDYIMEKEITCFLTNENRML